MMSQLRLHLRHQLRLFFVALQFFTRIPIPGWVGYEPAWLQQSARYFPAVGWIVGAVTAAAVVIAQFFLPPMVVVVCAMITGILLTGAFHEDGFADVCDGLGGGTTQERMLEIMTDSRVGAYGAIGIVMMLLSKYVLLSALPQSELALFLLVVHPISRLAAISLMVCLKYVKPTGKAKPVAHQMSATVFFGASISVVLPVAWMLYFECLYWQSMLSGVLLATAATWLMARLFVRKLGGYTGDCLGATQQLAEVCFYVGVLVKLA